jgi:type II secretory pathway component PulC
VRERIAARQRQVSKAPSQPGTNLRSFVDEYRDRINTDPAGLLNEIGISAVSEGEASGYRLSDTLPSAQMLQAGLQEGDLVLSVNGTPVGDVRSDAALIDQAMNDGRVRVEIQRADRRFFLTVPIPNE